MALLALSVTGAIRTLTGQSAAPGSRLLEGDHWVYEYLQRLRSRGYLSGLDPLAQPYTRAAIAHEIAGLDPDSLSRPVAESVRLLREEFEPELQPEARVRWGAVAAAGVRAATTDRLDPMRPLGTGAIWPNGVAGLWVETGAVALESRGVGDTWVDDDPDSRAPYRRLGAIADHTYLRLASRLGSVIVGRFARNWSALGTQSLLISANPLSYSSIGLEGRLGRFGMQAFTAELDTLAGAKRYVAAHRFSYAAPRFAVAVTETLLYGAPNSAPSIQFLNPLALFVVDQENPPSDDRSENLMLGLELWRTWGWLEVYGEGLLDDIDLHAEGPGRAPTRYGFTLGARFPVLARNLEGGVEYRRVSSFAYRSNRPTDLYDFLGRGLGDNFADYDGLIIWADLFPVTGLRVTPTFHALRQGEGDLRQPFPDYDVFLSSPSLFLGTPEHAYRLSLRGRYQRWRQAWLTWDVGETWTRNAGHILGERHAEFVAQAGLSVRLDLRKRVGMP